MTQLIPNKMFMLVSIEINKYIFILWLFVAHVQIEKKMIVVNQVCQNDSA